MKAGRNMLKIASFAVVAGTLMLGTAAFAPMPAFAQNRTVPAGDALAQTPPTDVRRKQLDVAPRHYRRQYKAYRRARGLPLQPRS